MISKQGFTTCPFFSCNPLLFLSWHSPSSMCAPLPPPQKIQTKKNFRNGSTFPLLKGFWAQSWYAASANRIFLILIGCLPVTSDLRELKAWVRPIWEWWRFPPLRVLRPPSGETCSCVQPCTQLVFLSRCSGAMFQAFSRLPSPGAQADWRHFLCCLRHCAEALPVSRDYCSPSFWQT